MRMFKQVILIHIFVVISITPSLQTDTECNCVEMKDCIEFVKGQRNLTDCSPTTAGQSQKRVCCPKEVKQSEVSKTLTTMKSAESVVAQKCAEYTEEVFQQVRESPNRTRRMDLCFQEPQILTWEPHLHQYPHLALIGFGEKKQWLCTGSLISENFVLTSGICSLGLKLSKDDTELWVRLGEEQETQTIQVIKRIIHPEFQKFQNDIALLQLAKPVKFGRTSRPACINVNASNHITSDHLIAAAWIKHDDGSFKVTDDHRRLVKGEICLKSLQRFRFSHNFQDENMICTSSQEKPKENQFYKESGYPLQIKMTWPYYCMFSVIGLSSIPLSPDRLIVGTRLSYYVPWIQQIVWPQTTSN